MSNGRWVPLGHYNTRQHLGAAPAQAALAAHTRNNYLGEAPKTASATFPHTARTYTQYVLADVLTQVLSAAAKLFHADGAAAPQGVGQVAGGAAGCSQGDGQNVAAGGPLCPTCCTPVVSSGLATAAAWQQNG
jgi:hypothetical protein